MINTVNLESLKQLSDSRALPHLLHCLLPVQANIAPKDELGAPADDAALFSVVDELKLLLVSNKSIHNT